jgi:hypothetical protein
MNDLLKVKFCVWITVVGAVIATIIYTLFVLTESVQ